jgi:hypothetical protein
MLLRHVVRHPEESTSANGKPSKGLQPDLMKKRRAKQPAGPRRQ